MSEDLVPTGRARGRARGRGIETGLENLTLGRGRGRGITLEKKGKGRGEASLLSGSGGASTESSLSSPATSSEGIIQELGRGAARKPTRGVRIRHPIITKPEDLSKKQGAGGIPIDLLTNYFSVVEKPEWSLYQYSVKFNPDLEDSRVSSPCFLY